MTNYEWLEVEIVKVKHNPDTYQDQCMLWPYAKNHKGYGWIHWIERYERPMLVHRVSFELYYGYPPSELVLHKCDTASCYNPLHLYDGDYWQNMMDYIERNPKSCLEIKLTPNDVKSIIRLLWTGQLTQQEIADRFGVVRSTITSIKNNRSWQQIPREPTIAESAQEYAKYELRKIVEQHGLTWNDEYDVIIQRVINYLIHATLTEVS